jgi:hypothetical protein
MSAGTGFKISFRHVLVMKFKDSYLGSAPIIRKAREKIANLFSKRQPKSEDISKPEPKIIGYDVPAWNRIYTYTASKNEIKSMNEPLSADREKTLLQFVRD